MRNIKNKLMMALAAGVFMMGSASLGGTAYSAEAENASPAEVQPYCDFQGKCEFFGVMFSARGEHQGRHRNENFDNLAYAEFMSNAYGVKRAEVIDAIQAGVNCKDLTHACVLSKASGESLERIMILHHNLDWRALADSLGVTHEEIRNIHQEIMAEGLAKRAHTDKETVMKLLKKNYSPRDIKMAGFLAKKSGRTIESVIGMKNINNTWRDVAKELKVSLRDRERNDGFRGHNREHRNGHGFGHSRHC